jgi:thiol-disulfide isomerase/thioredoxin
MNHTQFPELNEMEEIVMDKGVFSTALTVTQPEIMYLISYVNDSIEFNQPLFLKKGYTLTIDCKTKSGTPQLAITGKGASDNQPWGGSGSYIDFNDYPKDTLPDRIVAGLQKISDKNRAALQHYIALYKPSADFIKSWNVEMKYNQIRTYYVYAKQRIYPVKAAYRRNRKSWDDVFNRMLIDAPLMNEAALTSWGYRVFVKMFLIFNKPHDLDNEAYKNEFIKNYYVDGKDTGKRSYFKDALNIPGQKVIEKYFTGKVKEYLYASLFKMALESGIVTNIDSIYNDFCKQYPFSIYRTLYDDQIAAVMQSLQQPVNDKMIFEPRNIKTLAEVLNLFKGKTVLLDMWGTWCGPCREDIKNNAPGIKNYFKDKGLEYLYIANIDETRVNVWKSLITYYNMEGHHILATDDLTKDIEKNIPLPGYPAYVIIHRDGSYELSKAGMSTEAERKILIAQIEDALK